MRQIPFLVFALLTIAASAPAANAGVMIEPELGYHLAEWNGALTSGHWRARGIGLGVRAGYSYLGGQAFGEFQYAKPGLNSIDTVGFGLNTSATLTQVGFGVSYSFFGIRPMISYFFISNLDHDTSGTTGVPALYKGSAFKVGIGYSVHADIHVNAYYATGPYKERCPVGSTTCDTVLPGRLKSWYLTVSRPFDLY